jgi:hypothetical protein
MSESDDKLAILWNEYEKKTEKEKKPESLLSDNKNILILILIVAQALGMGPEVLTAVAKVLVHAP